MCKIKNQINKVIYFIQSDLFVLKKFLFLVQSTTCNIVLWVSFSGRKSTLAKLRAANTCQEKTGKPRPSETAYMNYYYHFLMCTNIYIKIFHNIAIIAGIFASSPSGKFRLTLPGRLRNSMYHLAAQKQC